MIIFEVIAPCIQLDLIGNQQWVNDSFYIKPIFDASSSQIHTFYIFERDGRGCIYGLLGEWNCQNPLETTQITRIKSHFKTLIVDQMLPQRIISELYEMIGGFSFSKEISLFMWTINQEQDLFTSVSKNFKHVLLSKRNDENGKIKRLNLGIIENIPNDMHQEKLSEMKQVVLPTNSYGTQSVENFEMKMHAVENLDVFKMAELINQCFYSEYFKVAALPRALIMDFESFISVKEYTLKSLKSHQVVIDQIIRSLPRGFEAFSVKLVVSELVSNAYIHGNQMQSEIPIKIIVSFTAKYCYIEVYDMRSDGTHITVPTVLNTENLLNENGRGLFLVKSVSESVYVGQNSTTAKLSKQEVLNA